MFSLAAPCRLLVGEGHSSEVTIGEALAEYLPHNGFEANAVIAVTAVAVAEHLFVDVAEQVKRLYRDVGSGNPRFNMLQKFSLPFVWMWP